MIHPKEFRALLCYVPGVVTRDGYNHEWLSPGNALVLSRGRASHIFGTSITPKRVASNTPTRDESTSSSTLLENFPGSPRTWLSGLGLTFAGEQPPGMAPSTA